MNFKESRAIYLQIADRICDDILLGQYEEEGRIPSVREYASIVEVNANTVMRSYEYLQSQEVIYNKRGIGFFVASGAKALIHSLRKEQFLKEEVDGFFRQLYTLGISIKEEEKMYYEELVLRYLTLKNKGTRYSQANIQDYMDDYLESQCKEFDDTQIETDKTLFVNIMKILEKLKDENIFKLGKRYFTTSMYDAIMLSLSENTIDLEELNIEQLGKKIAILKEDDNFNKYVGSASSNPTSITNKVKIARKVLLDITE